MGIVPKFNELIWPTLKAIKVLGGSASNVEIVQKVIEQEGFSEEIQNEMHGNSPRTELEYRMAWAKTYLKNYGALENSERGVWSITNRGENLDQKDIQKIITKMRKETINKRQKEKLLSQEYNNDEENLDTNIDVDVDWETNLLNIIQNELSPKSFERLVQRILRESGFVEVEVTGKAGDGGVDGYGVLKVGLLSFRVIFQCKRYKGTISPNYIRDFRGAMQGRAEKGLFMTTGTFTTAAKKEALRDGAPPIELFDGNDICELIKRFRLGVDVETQESVIIKPSWFQKL